MSDLRRVGVHPDFWHPVAWSEDIKEGSTLAVSFAGEPIVLIRSAEGLFALEDRCAHRQVPLSEGVLCGKTLRCGYHGWAFGMDGRCLQVPNLGGTAGKPGGVRTYPVREAHGLVFVFPGDPAKAAERSLPQAPAASDPSYKTRRLSRRINCHYSFMHENLMDMNHQYLHRRLMGAIQAILLDSRKGPDFVEATYRFSRIAGSQSLGERFMIGRSAKVSRLREHDVMVIRTSYPYQTLTFTRADREKPALDLWLAYVPQNAQQSVNHSFGLMSIERPAIPGLIHLFWPFICLFTSGIFRQDKWVVELEQKAWERQNGDRNNEIFPLIRDLRAVLGSNGVALN